MKFTRLLYAILREIFEESAYERFCVRDNLPPGRDSYAQFLRESGRAAGIKVRCC